jgi:hypothetical protein
MEHVAGGAVPYADEYLWIDQISIDQGNIPEKNIQVALMSSIFSNAAQVVVWLGDEADESTAAMECLAAVGSTQNALFDPERPMLAEIYPRHSLPAVAIYKLFERPYWTRVWVIQEVLLAGPPNLTWFCGTASVPGPVMQHAHRRLCWDWYPYWRSYVGEKIPDPNVLLHNNILFLPELSIFHFDDEGMQVFAEDMEGLIYETISFGCKDPRDRIYGLMALIKEKRKGMEIDYTKPAPDVFWEFMSRSNLAQYVTRSQQACILYLGLIMGVTGHEHIDAAQSDNTGCKIFMSIFQGRTPEDIFSILLANKARWEAMFQSMDKWRWSDIPGMLEQELQSSQRTAHDVEQKASIWA